MSKFLPIALVAAAAWSLMLPEFDGIVGHALRIFMCFVAGVVFRHEW